MSNIDPESERGAVQIAVTPETELLKHIEAGIEEEDVPWSVSSVETGSVTELAQSAADRSAIDIGIGVSDRQIWLVTSDVRTNKAFLSYECATKAEARLLGTNAGRLARRRPLRLNTE